MANISFGNYIPVIFYARNPLTKQFNLIHDKEDIRKCQSFVVRNLNHTAKNMKNDEFVKRFKEIDKDYEKNSVVRSIYDTEKPAVYMVTGNDTNRVNEMGKELRVKKNEAREREGKAYGYSHNRINREYFEKTRHFLKHICKRVQNENGEKLTLEVFFEPKYTKKEHKFIGYEYKGSRYTTYYQEIDIT